MKNTISLLILVFILSNSGDCQDHKKITPGQKQKLEQLKKEVTGDLTRNILPYWSAKMVDNVNGGFYGRIDGNNKVYPEVEKGGILNARILWTYSSAYRVMGDTSYLRLAKRAKDYILAHFIDSQYGGAYMSLKADGTPSNTRKHVYTNAFFIYALAEYSRATGDKQALAEARKIFELFEKYAADREYGGYYEVFSQDWQRIRERLIGESSDKDEKTMNTSLHVMEAYANLYRVSGDKFVGDRLRNLVEIFLDKIIDKKTSHLICFLDRTWNSTSTVDSYGHDIESSWLLDEAAGLLKDKKLIERVKAAGLKIANAAEEGYQSDGSMLTEKNYATGHFRTQRSWWEQAETIVGYLNAFELTG
ncbi:MAG: AGE family epimerase/isomerase, partial [Bacteroidia bacterium]|nr:AGE family epimerase/isomerase [Bacteroidia bacterium]